MRLRYVLPILLSVCCALLTACGQHALNETDNESPAVGQPEKGIQPSDQQAESAKETLAAGPPPDEIAIHVEGVDVTLSWESLNPGDYNVDGTVNGLDVFPLAANFDRAADEEPGLECIDGNGDNTLNGQDLFLIAVNFQNRIDEYEVYSDISEDGLFGTGPMNPTPLLYAGCGDTVQLEFINEIDGIWLAVKAVDTDAGDWSDIGPPVQKPDPPEPTNLLARANDGSFEVAWPPETEHPELLDHWEIEMQPPGLSEWIPVAADYTVNEGDEVYGLIIFPAIEVDNGDLYSMRLRGVDPGGNASTWLQRDGLTGDAAPEPPESVWRANGDASVELHISSSPSTDRAGYSIYRSSSPGGPWTRRPTVGDFSRLPASLHDSSEGTLLFSDDGLINEQNYFYKTHTVDEFGVESELYDIRGVQPSAAPAAPTGLSLVNMDAAVALDWEDNTEPDLAYYRLYWSQVSGGPYTEGSFTIADSEHVHINLTNETDYYFCVAAFDDNGVRSQLSAEIAGHPSGPPATPTGFAGYGRYLDTEILLSWDAVSDPDTQMVNIYRSAESGGAMDLLSERPDFETEYAWGNRGRGVTWYFELRAVDEWGVLSDPTPEIAVTTPDWQWEIVEQGGHVGEFSSLVIDQDGHPLIAYYDSTNFDPKCAMFDGTDWDISVVYATGNAGRGTSMGILGNGYPVVSFLSATDESLYWSYWNGSNWASFELNAVDGPFNEVTSMEQDSLGQTGICMVEQGGGDLIYGYHEGGPDWDWHSIDSHGDGYYEPCLAFDHSDKPAISVRGWSSESLKLVRWNGVDWDVETVTSGGDIGRMSSIAFDHLGNPVIAHGDTALNLEWFNGVSWDHTTIDDSDSCRYPSLVLQDGRIPIISYRHQAEGDLFMAWYKGDTWEIEELRTGAGSCSYTSIALDDLGNPVISLAYYYGGPRSLAVSWFR